MKLTPTMLHGLAQMEKNLRRQPETLAEPNDNTGKALEKRGLVVRVAEKTNGWNYYRLTEAGRTALRDRGET